jgi:uncharacterized protein
MSSAVAAGNLETVRRFYDSLQAGDMETATSLVHEDVVVDESNDLPYGGVYHGKAGLMELGGKLYARLAAVPAAENEYISDDDKVVVLLKAKFTSHTTGKSLTSGVVEVATLRDGLIASLDVYYKAPGSVALLEQ